MTLKKIFNGIKFYPKLFTPPTVDDVIKGDIALEQKMIDYCDMTIRNARFQRHMAQAKIAAMHSWRQQEAMIFQTQSIADEWVKHAIKSEKELTDIQV